MSNDGIRAGADDPVTSGADVAPAYRCVHRCGHDLEAWLIGRKLEPWHVVATGEGNSTVLTECDSPPATAKRQKVQC